MCCLSGLSVCLANCLIFVWIWFPSLHLHYVALVFFYLQGLYKTCRIR